MTEKRQKQLELEARYAIRTEDFLNSVGKAGIYIFLYFPKEHVLTMNEDVAKTCHMESYYDFMPYGYVDRIEDLKEREDCLRFYREIDDGADMSVADFMQHDMGIRMHVTMTTIRRDEEGNPEVAIGVIENTTELYKEKQLLGEVTEQLNQQMMEACSESEEEKGIIDEIASGIGELYYAIYHIQLEDKTYVCYREELAGILGKIGARGKYEPAWDAYIEHYIIEEDRSGLAEFANIHTMAERLKDKKSISHVYRRKGIGWTRGQFIVVNRDEDGNVLHVIFAVTDINDEMETKLEKERAIRDARHDDLTGLLNRKAFDEEKNQTKFLEKPLGIVAIDIDRFKDINDIFGHSYGDEIICKVGELLQVSLRKEDLAFRVGGDEFVILIHNCSIEEWPEICERLSEIHENLRSQLLKNYYVTLSAGMCISEEGYSQEQMRLADLAMYHTKAKGRGGITLMNRDRRVVREWHDDKYQLRNNYILEGNNTATWKAELPKSSDVKGRIYFDDTMKSMLGIGNTLSPEEQYELWITGVEESYLETVINAMDAVIKKENVEILYRWRHPQYGYILTRWGAAYEKEDENFYHVYGYYHEMKGTHVFTKLEISDEIRNSLEEIYYCNIYINLKNLTYTTYKMQPYMREILDDHGDAFETVSVFVNHVVAPEHKELMEEFLNLKSLSERLAEKNVIECDYLESDYGWCRAKFIVVKRDENGNAEAVTLVVESIDEQKKADLEQKRELQDRTEVINCFSEEFESLVYMDFEEDRFFAMSDNDYFVNEIGISGSISESLQNAFYSLMAEENDENVKIYADIAQVERVLRSTDHLRVEFKVSYGGRCLAEYHVMRRREDGRPSGVMVTSLALEDRGFTSEEERMEELAVIPRKSGVDDNRTMESFFNNVPAGLIMYEWDGKQLKTIYISEYYARKYGNTLVSEGSNKGGPDFMRVHPEDLAAYQEAVLEGLSVTHRLDYTYRVWDEEDRAYRWNRINAISIPQTDGTSLVYALYTDITDQKEAQMKLEKNKSSMEAALMASNQLCYEYDPVMHTGVCYTESNFFGLPKEIAGYPDSLTEFDLFHPEDARTFIHTAHRMDESTDSAQCDVRIKKNGEYAWYNCEFTSYYDEEKGYNVAILNVVDIDVRVTAINTYEERMQTLMYMNEDAICVGNVNLTKGVFVNYRASEEIRNLVGDKHNYDDMLRLGASCVVGEKHREEYLQRFSRENLLQMERMGIAHVQMEHMLRMSNNHTEWLETTVDMIRNPITGDMEGICSCRSIHEAKMNELLLEKTMEQDYPMAAVVSMDNEEYYFYSAEQGIMGRRRVGFWDSIVTSLSGVAEDTDRIRKSLDKEHVLGVLEHKKEYIFAFAAADAQKEYRLEFKFSYLDSEKKTIFASLRNITDRLLLDKLRYDNEHDKLTSLYNRNTVFKKCRRLLEENPKDAFVMLHFDINHFHLYNSFYGDTAGDELLCDIANRLKAIGANFDTWTYGRIEADVFCLFFPYKKEQLHKELKAAMEELKNYRDDFLIEPSVGIYYVSDRTMPVEAMFTRATMAAKTNKNVFEEAVSMYDESMELQMKKEQEIVNEMYTALQKGQFVPYFQPKFSLRTEKPVGAEALVRWMHPKKGMVSPGEFIPLFERNGFIADLDRYMWEEVCKLLKKWKEEYDVVAPISVNVSRISMYSPATVQFLKDLVTNYEIEPELLQLELTESAYMDDPVEIKAQLVALREFGFKILMDDFGSGYSSLNTLRELPVDCIKLDMRFLRESHQDTRAQLVLSSIVRMSKLLNLCVVAEGVEYKEQANYLRSLGCEYAQGFLFARPMPLDEYVNLMDHQEELQIETYPKEGNVEKYLTNEYMKDLSLAEEFPMPVAVVESGENGFICLRMNRVFIKDFDMRETTEVTEEKFKKNLPEDEYAAMLEAFAECATDKQDVSFKFSWKKENGEERVYCGRAGYKGDLGSAHLLLVTFANISNYVQ